MEKKKEICEWLKIPISMTRAGEDVRDIIYDEMTQTADIVFVGGYRKTVNLFADSGIAIIADICRALQ